MNGQVQVLTDPLSGSQAPPIAEPRELSTRLMERLVAAVEVKNAEVEHFVDRLLKTPLVTIKGFITLLRRDAAAGDRELVADDVRQINQAADRLHRLLDELFDYHRIGHRPMAPEITCLAAVARQALDRVSCEVVERGVEVVIAPDLPSVVGDPARLLEVLQHLLENAVKFLGDQQAPRIEVGAREAGGETIFYVRDNGIGIEPRDHEKVFQLFQQLGAHTPGTGAGLALAQRIVEVHGGRIWVESAGHGAGTELCFTLPSGDEEGLTS